MELIKIVGCFLDGNGKYDIYLVSFRKNLSKKILFQLRRVKSVPNENKMLGKNEIPKKKISSFVRF